MHSPCCEFLSENPRGHHQGALDAPVQPRQRGEQGNRHLRGFAHLPDHQCFLCLCSHSLVRHLQLNRTPIAGKNCPIYSASSSKLCTYFRSSLPIRVMCPRQKFLPAVPPASRQMRIRKDCESICGSPLEFSATVLPTTGNALPGLSCGLAGLTAAPALLRAHSRKLCGCLCERLFFVCWCVAEGVRGCGSWETTAKLLAFFGCVTRAKIRRSARASSQGLIEGANVLLHSVLNLAQEGAQLL
jgi:hypothetical protein